MDAAFPLEITPDVPLLCPAFTLEGLRVRATNAALEEALAVLAKDLRERWAGTAIGEVPGIQAVRGAYRAMGLDPTRCRPSSEALLRRILRGEQLYRINTLVDALNYCSLKYLVPFGLYDLDRVHGPVVLRLGRDGEGYAGIRKEYVNVAGRACLVDEQGPFGNPSADSARTQIVLETTRALVAPFLPKETPGRTVEAIVTGTAQALRAYC